MQLVPEPPIPPIKEHQQQAVTSLPCSSSPSSSSPSACADDAPPRDARPRHLPVLPHTTELVGSAEVTTTTSTTTTTSASPAATAVSSSSSAAASPSSASSPATAIATASTAAAATNSNGAPSTGEHANATPAKKRRKQKSQQHAPQAPVFVASPAMVEEYLRACSGGSVPMPMPVSMPMPLVMTSPQLLQMMTSSQAHPFLVATAGGSGTGSGGGTAAAHGVDSDGIPALSNVEHPTSCWFGGTGAVHQHPQASSNDSPKSGSASSSSPSPLSNRCSPAAQDDLNRLVNQARQGKAFIPPYPLLSPSGWSLPPVMEKASPTRGRTTNSQETAPIPQLQRSGTVQTDSRTPSEKPGPKSQGIPSNSVDQQNDPAQLSSASAFPTVRMLVPPNPELVALKLLPCTCLSQMSNCQHHKAPARSLPRELTDSEKSLFQQHALPLVLTESEQDIFNLPSSPLCHSDCTYTSSIAQEGIPCDQGSNSSEESDDSHPLLEQPPRLDTKDYQSASDSSHPSSPVPPQMQAISLAQGAFPLTDASQLSFLSQYPLLCGVPVMYSCYPYPFSQRELVTLPIGKRKVKHRTRKQRTNEEKTPPASRHPHPHLHPLQTHTHRKQKILSPQTPLLNSSGIDSEDEAISEAHSTRKKSRADISNLVCAPKPMTPVRQLLTSENMGTSSNESSDPKSDAMSNGDADDTDTEELSVDSPDYKTERVVLPPCPQARDEVGKLQRTFLAFAPPVVPHPAPKTTSPVSNVRKPTKSAVSNNAPPSIQPARFRIIQEPYDIQRKSYKNENRYILPNPIIVAWAGSTEDTVTGTVEVYLATETGEEMSPEWQEILDTPAKCKPLDEDKRASFALRMLATSGDLKFRLLFKVKYNLGAGDLTERLVSTCYRVESNRKKCPLERPKVWQLDPAEGYASQDVPVCIWGSKLGDKNCMKVLFGSQEATIKSVGTNHLECTVPAQQLIRDMPVRVNVANLHPQQGPLWATEVLLFTYRVQRSTSPAVEQPQEQRQKHDQQQPP
ncbi:hypothetical protein Pelo_7181 [Pelomyxa schiedti]|nr:hypothetical protein Pelo_7181 [Pelomyxa schiedti]